MQEERQTLIADFAIRGRLAYLSHQETLTCLTRSLLRAGVPIAFSGGFSPRPRLSLPLPRSVGTQSCAERLCAVLSTGDFVCIRKIRRQLEKQLPADCMVLDIRCMEGKQSFHADIVHYVFTLAQAPTHDHQTFLADCRTVVEGSGRIEVQRYQAKKKTRQPFDITPFIKCISVFENIIEVSCRVCQEGTVRIDELMQWLHLEAGQLKEPVKRTDVQWIEN